MCVSVWCHRTKGQDILMLVTNKTWTQMWTTEAGWVGMIVGTKKRQIKKEDSENWLKGKVSEKERNVWSKMLLLFRVLTAWNVRAEINVVSHTHRHTHTFSHCQMFFSQWATSSLVSLGQPSVSHTHTWTHTPTVKIWPVFLSSAVRTFTVCVCQKSLFYQWRHEAVQLTPLSQHRKTGKMKPCQRVMEYFK